MAVPYIFSTATSAIPLSQLDSNFATAITLGNTAVYLGNTTTSIGNLTLTNVTISSVASTFPNSFLSNSSVTIGSTNVSLGGTASSISGLTGVSSSSITDTGLTSTYVTYAGTGGLLSGSANMTFNGTSLTLANDASISGLTVGLGGGSVSTNVVLGQSALNGNTTGSNIVAIGYQSMQGVVTGTDLVAVGLQSLYSNTSGSGNSAVGRNSLRNNSTGFNNCAFGSFALYSNTTASYNTAVGYQAGYSNTTGASHTAVGFQALYSNSTGAENTAIGFYSLFNNSTGSYNVALGKQSLLNNTTASYNTAVGYQAGYSTTTGASNTAMGYYALQSNSTSSFNTALGYYAGSAVTGTNNLCLGSGSGAGNVNLTSGTYNVLIGTNASTNGASDNYEIVVSATSNATAAVGKGSSTGFINPNSGGVYQGNNSSSWSTTSDQRIKKNIVDNNIGLEKITQIQVRNFEYRLPEEVDLTLKPTDAINREGVQLGVIAQEIQKIIPECVKQESTGVFTVDEGPLTWYLINAVKELSAQVAQLQSQLGK